MKKRIELSEIHNGYLMTFYSENSNREIGYQWGQEHKMVNDIIFELKHHRELKVVTANDAAKISKELKA